MRTLFVAFVCASGAVFTACASAPPELTSARMEVHAARGGELGPADTRDLTEARNALDEADAYVDRAGDPDVVRDLAYVASRRVERARIVGRTDAMIDTPVAAAPEARRTRPSSRATGGGPARTNAVLDDERPR